jgi:catechol 2,3-dioxygenase-like lactoylglutathione lyase family enzyme
VVEETLKFYREFLGLAELERPANLSIPGAWLQAGEAQIHLIGAKDDGRPGNPIGPHYAVLVEDLEQAVREIEAAGLHFLRIGNDRSSQVWITDPAGNTIELQQDPDA